MTHNAAHANNLLFELRIQHQKRIEHLQEKIAQQQQEIVKLQEQIKLLTQEKYYDC